MHVQADQHPPPLPPATAQSELLTGVLEALPSPTVLIDADGIVLLANPAWAVGTAQLVGVADAGVGDDYFALLLALAPDGGNAHRVAELRDLAVGARGLVSADHEVDTTAGRRWVHLQASQVGKTGRVVVTHTDVTERVQAHRHAVWQARHDPLTGLPNRAHLYELLTAAVLDPDRGSLAVLFLDVDGFKGVNDTLGHDRGDQLLRELGRRFTEVSRVGDTVARLGGDEFVVLGSGCDAPDAVALADRFRDAFAAPFQLGSEQVALSVSIGVAVHPADVGFVGPAELVRRADSAMYAAKAAGRNRVRVHADPGQGHPETAVLTALPVAATL